jgi:hypothetical protein
LGKFPNVRGAEGTSWPGPCSLPHGQWPCRKRLLARSGSRTPARRACTPPCCQRLRGALVFASWQQSLLGGPAMTGLAPGTTRLQISHSSGLVPALWSAANRPTRSSAQDGRLTGSSHCSIRYPPSCWPRLLRYFRCV